MAEVDFSDVNKATAWFETQSREKRCLMSSRAALRVLAHFGRYDGEGKKPLGLAVMRAILTSAARGVGRAADVQELEQAAHSAADSAHVAAHEATLAANSTTNTVAFAAHSAAHSASGSIADSNYYAALSVDSAARSAAHSASGSIADSNYYAALSADAAALSAISEDAERTENELFERPVWQEVAIPAPIMVAHEAWLAHLSSDPVWTFWHCWYRDMWDGTFRDWDLTVEVAKLPNELWQGDDAPEKVAEAIRGIEAKHHLLTEIADLRAQVVEMRRAVLAPAQGHNQGPPLDDVAAAQIHRQFELVSPILDSLEEEAKKEAPDPGRLQSLALALWEIAQKIVAYCGGVLDVGLTKAAETLGEQGTKWTVRVLATEAVASNSGVQSVAKAAWKFAQALGGGG